MDKTEKSIIKTLSFYDLLGKPLMLEEIWRFLYGHNVSKLNVLMGLKGLLKGKIISKAISKNNHIYYFLKNQKTDPRKYFANFEISTKRWKKVERVLGLLEYAPFIKNISVINSLSYNNANENSDIDILIITKKNRLWTARALTIILLEIIGQNKNQWYKAGKFCLGFAFDETRLNMEKIRLDKDIDFTYWLANLTPVYDKGIYQNLIEQNSWLKEELPNWEEREVKSKKEKVKIIEKLLIGRFGEKLEKWLAKIQINRIKKDPKNHRQGASVIADGSMMKLHAYDKRLERQKEWLEKVRKLGA